MLGRERGLKNWTWSCVINVIDWVGEKLFVVTACVCVNCHLQLTSCKKLMTEWETLWCSSSSPTYLVTSYISWSHLPTMMLSSAIHLEPMSKWPQKSWGVVALLCWKRFVNCTGDEIVHTEIPSSLSPIREIIILYSRNITTPEYKLFIPCFYILSYILSITTRHILFFFSYKITKI